MNTLTVSHETFLKMISGLIKSGVRFTSKEEGDYIIIEFTGGY